MKPVQHTDYILTIEEFWTAEKCDEFIRKSELLGYEPAMVQTENGPKRVEGVRNNQRILFTDNSLAQELWSNLKNHIQQNLGNSVAIGLNEMFRFYKYEPGQEFKKHRDQSFIRNEVESSYYTFMIYLNDDFTGGETTFNEVTITPKKGSTLVFFHDLEHEGTKLISGSKYILRTDIMYKFNE